MDDYGVLFKVVRGILRWSTPRYRIQKNQEIPSPSILLCRHNNMLGPRVVLTWLPEVVRIWTFHVFMDCDACYRQYVDYTFTERFGWSQWRAKLSAKIFAPLVVRFYNSMGAIPVFRDSMQTFATIKLTLKSLLDGNRVMIFPDIKYSSTDSEERSIYEGFIYLERYYYKKTGKHLPFVPVYVNHDTKEIVIREAICFADGIDFYDQKDQVIDLLVERINATE